MTLDEILDMWEQDAVINEAKLGSESSNTPILHSKYLRLLMANRLKVAKLDSDIDQMRQIKFRYYRGELTQEELKEHGWKQWAYAKPLKNEMEEFLKGDSDLVKLKLKAQYTKTIVETLEAILIQIKARDWQIRNAIEHLKFINGS